MGMVLPQCVHWRASGCYCGLLSLLPKSAKGSLTQCCCCFRWHPVIWPSLDTGSQAQNLVQSPDPPPHTHIPNLLTLVASLVSVTDSCLNALVLSD